MSGEGGYSRSTYFGEAHDTCLKAVVRPLVQPALLRDLLSPIPLVALLNQVKGHGSDHMKYHNIDNSDLIKYSVVKFKGTCFVANKTFSNTFIKVWNK